MHKKGIREVAHIAGVSISTVSRAFTRPELVSEKTRERVMEAASMLDFNISRSATALKSGQTFRVALLMNEEVTSWFNTQVFTGLNSVLHDAGYDISLFQHIDELAQIFICQRILPPITMKSNKSIIQGRRKNLNEKKHRKTAPRMGSRN